MNIRTYLILLLCCVFGRTVKAQDTSLNVLSQQFKQQYNFLAKETVSQPLIDSTTYGILSAGIRYTAGTYKLSQDADRQKDLYFFTEGSKMLRKVRVSGLFTYQHSWLDSAGHTLRYGLNNPEPYYFYAGKRGNWEAGVYRLQGIVSFPVLHDRLMIGAGANYEGVNAWRSNDPRPETFISDIQGQLTLHYKLLQNHTLGVEGGLIRKFSETGIEYRNTDYNYSTLYPEYISYLQYGYGFAALQIGNRRVMANANGGRLQGVYNGIFPLGNIILKGGFTRLTSAYTRAAILTDPGAYYGSFYEDITQASLLWRYKKGPHQWSATVQYNDHLGRDFNALLNGNNYVYSSEQLSIQPMYGHFRKNKVHYELGLQASISNLYKADGTMNQSTNYQQLMAGITGAYYHYTGRQSFWKGLVHIGMNLPGSLEIRMPVQLTPFITNVVLPDYYFYNSSAVTAKAELLYQLPVNKTRTFLKLEAQFQQASVGVNNKIPSESKPGSNRGYIEMSIGVTL